MTMVENRENVSEVEIKGENDINVPELQFTGNWFIDAGILGFVNLMEDVYGWNLDELKNRTKENPQLIYYGYFPFAYVSNSLYLNDEIQYVIDELENSLSERQFESSEDIFNFVWENHISKIAEDKWKFNKMKKLLQVQGAYNKKGEVKPDFNDEIYLDLVNKREKLVNILISENQDELKKLLNKRGKIGSLKYEDIEQIEQLDFDDVSETFTNNVKKLKESNLELKFYLGKTWNNEIVGNPSVFEEKSKFYRIPLYSGFYGNFVFFNNSYGYYKQKDGFYNLISFKVEQEAIMSKIDKTINKFMASEDKFPNISYTTFSTAIFREAMPFLFVYFLCFSNVFEYFKGIGYTLFYSNGLNFTYKLNKRLKTKKSKIEDSGTLFRVTWQEIIDLVIEFKSQWSLENLYVIKYQKLDNRAQNGIEYMGIPKLQAMVIIDDQIRKSLNKNLQISGGDNSKWIWLIEEFIRSKPLFPHILNHLVERVKNKIKKGNKKTLLYSLAVDAQIRTLKRYSRKSIFEPSFFQEYEDIVFQIKESNKWMNLASRNAYEVFSSNNKDKIIHRLITSIKKQNKHAFMNIILKALLEERKKDPKIVKYLNDYLFNNIIQNETNWQNYALAILVGLL